MKRLIRNLFIWLNTISLKLNNVEIGNKCNIRGKILVKNNSKKRIIIGNNVTINSGMKYNPIGFQGQTMLYIIENGSISIGNRVGISNSSIVSQNKIIIEDDVMIGGGVKIYDTDFHSKQYEIRMSEHDTDINTAPVIIKRGAFIGAGSIILKGVSIGRKSIVGAGSVVTKNIPDNEIWAGNPAKFIRKLN